MKKMGELMKDMGFNPNSATSAQEAFIKHLVKSAYGVDVLTPSEKKIIQDNPQKIVSLKSISQQMAFDFESAPDVDSHKKTGT